MDKKMIYIRWLDAAFMNDGSFTTEELTQIGVELESVGFLIRESEEGLLIGMEFCSEEGGSYREIVSVPASYIIEKKYFSLENIHKARKEKVKSARKVKKRPTRKISKRK